MTPTPEQQAVLDVVGNGTENLTVSAVAGSGKSTTIVHACGLAGSNSAFAAFNNQIVAELKPRINGSGDCLTLHSLGFRIIKQRSPCTILEKGQSKTKRLLRQLWPQIHSEGRGRWKGHFFLKEPWDVLPDVVDVCRQQVVFPDDEERARVVRNSCLTQGIDVSAFHPGHRLWTMAAEATRGVLEDLTTCDFTDMIAQPLYHQWVQPQYRTLFLDESQDLSPMQQLLALGSADRIVAVGDPQQAIMGFAGSSVDAFPSMARRLGERSEGCLTLPLSCCFRCPTSHLDLARILVPHIRPTPDAPTGILEDATPEQLLQRSEPGDLVLCRNTAPLIELAFAFIAARKPCMVRGRSIGDGLTALVKRLRATSISGLLTAIQRWYSEQIENLQSPDGAASEELQQATDKHHALMVLASDCDTIEEVYSTISSLFSDADPTTRVCLSTVHRAKGLEAPRVWLYEPGLMPSRPGQQQELNLLYVALTRSKRELYMVDHHTRRTLPMRGWVEAVAQGASRWELTECDTDTREGKT